MTCVIDLVELADPARLLLVPLIVFTFKAFVSFPFEKLFDTYEGTMERVLSGKFSKCEMELGLSGNFLAACVPRDVDDDELRLSSVELEELRRFDAAS